MQHLFRPPFSKSVISNDPFHSVFLCTFIIVQTPVSDFRPCNFDETQFIPSGYNYQKILDDAHTYDYFQFNAPDFSNDVVIGFSNSFTGHDDAKWEIVLGAWFGTKDVIRDANLSPVEGIVQTNNDDR